MAADSRLSGHTASRRLLIPSLRTVLLALCLLSVLSPLPVVHAAYVESAPCKGQSSFSLDQNDFSQTSLNAFLIPAGMNTTDTNRTVNATTLEISSRFSYEGNRTCADFLSRRWDASVTLDRPGNSTTSLLRPSTMSCTPPSGNVTSLSLRVSVHNELGPLGPLPVLATALSLGPRVDGQVHASICTYSEITPALSYSTLLGLRLGPVAVFTLVLLAGVLATLYEDVTSPAAMLHRRWTSVDGISSRGGITATSRAILPGVGDCLLHLQFIFLMGALTVRYPGFYQPVTAQLSWASLFSPVGPVGLGNKYPSVADRIYEINGTLTGTFGFELLSQITGGPMRMDVWWNMVILAAMVVIATAVILQVPRVMPTLRERFTSTPKNQPPPPPKLNAARTTWNVIKVVMSYFLTPIVALSAFQLCNLFLPVYHLVLASLLILAVIVCFLWMSRVAPKSQLGNLFLGGAKQQYQELHQRNSSGGDARQRPQKPKSNKASERNLFTMIFFAAAFIRGTSIGALQFVPLAQIITLGAVEVTVFISVLFLRPFVARDMVVSTGCSLARFAVVILSVAFLPQLDVDIQKRSSVGYVILFIHLAVLTFGCAVPAILRMIRLAHTNLMPLNGKQVYGLDRLRKRSTMTTKVSTSDSRSESGRPLVGSPGLMSPASVHSLHPSSTLEQDAYLDGNRSPVDFGPRAATYDRFFREPRAKTSLASLRSPSSPISVGTSSGKSPIAEDDLESAPSLTKAKTLQLPTRDSLGPRRHSSSSVMSDGTLVDASEPPLPLARPALAPRWGDYSFREADLYYRQPPAYDDEENGQEWTSTSNGSGSRQDASRSPASGTGVWSHLKGSKSNSGGGGGFEVRRPPRPVPEGSPASAQSGTFEVRRPPKPAEQHR